MKVLTGISIFLLLFSVEAKTQKTIKIEFDTSGRMVKFPPPIIRPHDKLQFTITTTQQFVKDELTGLTDRLQKAVANLTAFSNPDGFSCFFGMSPADYAKNLQADIDFITKISICTRADSNQSKKLDATKVAPLTNYLNHVYEKQFEVKIVGGNKKTIDSVWLTFVGNNCQNTCITFQGTEVKNIGDLTKSQCPSCTVDSLSFQLVYHSPINNTMVDLFNGHKPGPDGFDLANFNSNFEPLDANFNPTDNTQCGKYTTAYNIFHKLIDWFKDWFWYTGKIALSPVPIASSPRQNQIKDSIVLMNTELDTIADLEHYVDSAKAKMFPTDWRYHVYKHLIERKLTLKQEYSTDSSLLVILKKEQDQEFASINKLAQTSSFIYGGKLMVSRSGHLIVQKQFDALNFYQRIYKNRRQDERMTEIPENERLVLMIQNSDTAAIYNLNEKPAAFNDLESLTLQATNALSGANINTPSTAQYTNFANAVASFFNAGPVNKGGVSPGESPTLPKDVKAEPCACYQAYPWLKSAYDALKQQTDTFLTADLLKQQPFGKALNSTVILRPLPYNNTYPAPYCDTIYIKNTVRKDSAFAWLKIGALRTFQLAAGIVFLSHPVTNTQIDTAAGTLKPVSSTNAATTFFGFKLYVFAKNYNRDNPIIPRYPLRRISLFAGFDFLHPLNNFYVGGGYDIIPGLAFLAGDNIYLRTYNQIQNNQIINTSKSYRSGGFAYGIVVNPILFAQYIKTFF